MKKEKIEEPLFIKGEIWKWIPGYENLYMASTEGRIKSFSSRFKNGYFIKRQKAKDGYHKLTVIKGYKDKGKSLSWHKAIAITFLENPENKPQINHKNGIRTDNRLINLEFATPEENMQHAFRELGRKVAWEGKKGKECKMSKAVIKMDKDFNEIETFDSALEATNATKIPSQNIGQVCLGKRKFAGGWRWKFAI